MNSSYKIARERMTRKASGEIMGMWLREERPEQQEHQWARNRNTAEVTETQSEKTVCSIRTAEL